MEAVASKGAWRVGGIFSLDPLSHFLCPQRQVPCPPLQLSFSLATARGSPLLIPALSASSLGKGKNDAFSELPRRHLGLLGHVECLKLVGVLGIP